LDEEEVTHHHLEERIRAIQTCAKPIKPDDGDINDVAVTIERLQL
jgi:hypothetical protein